IPDVNGDGVVASFDMVAAFLHVANGDELDSSEFPADFEATYFPFGDPSSIDLGDEADQQLAKALAADGIERLLFALIAAPTAIAEHFLRLALTAVAMLLYAGVPFAMLFAFFVYTQAFLGAYLKQFVNLLIETFMSVIIAGLMIGLLAAAAQQGVGLFIAASLLTLFVLLWRIKSALRLAGAAFDLFGGAMLTGGAGGMEMANMGRQAALGTASLAGAALTGGATLALGTAVVGAAAALQADGQRNGALLQTDPAKTAGRVAQLKTIAGYTFGRSETARGVIEGAHEVRTLGRNFRDGAVQEHEPNTLDYLRAGSSMSGFGSSPWLAMRLSPSLRAAYDEIGGRRVYDTNTHPLIVDDDGATLSPATPRTATVAAPQLGEQFAALHAALAALTAALSSPDGLQRSARGPEAGPAVVRGGPEQGSGQRAAPSSARPPAPAVQDVRLVERGLDLDHDGREDKYETSGAQPAGRGVVSLQLPDPGREAATSGLIGRLADGASPAGHAAYQALVTHAGPHNAGLLRQAVSAHGADAVQAAAEATAAMVAEYRRQGLGDAEILTAFQSGDAATVLRSTVDTPLADAELSAVADLVLLPERRLTRAQLASVIGAQVAAGSPTVEGVQAAIGSPVHFGGQTGNIRGVIAGAQALQLAPEELARLAEQIAAGLREAVQAELLQAGHRPEVVHPFVSSLAALPAAVTVPQTTATPVARNDEENSEEA
ncbi:MAG: type IV secretion system protein, partial [Chloroflexi bacterium]|nr:type IV secretion system protein [Chloroflexota bacterium]